MTPASAPEKQRYVEATADVARFFGHPAAVVASTEFSQDEKVALLKQWEVDLRLLMVAADENMAPGPGDRSGDQLRQVHAALAELGVESGDEGAPTKTGGA